LNEAFAAREIERNERILHSPHREGGEDKKEIRLETMDDLKH
jgi:hypothetical protein